MSFLKAKSQMVAFVCWLWLITGLSRGSLLPVISNNASYLNYYYVLMPIGTPSQQIPLMIDTSSSHTYLNSHTLRYETQNGYQASKSSSFSWLTCLDAEHCNVCLENHKQCGWEFACEQIYVMAKDAIHLEGSDDDYIVFGYNEKQPTQQKTHVFSLDDTQNNMVLGGILSLNRQKTSFAQQRYNHQNRKIFGHYFNGNDGFMAFGADNVHSLIKKLNLKNSDISWSKYLQSDVNNPSLYQTYFEQVELSGGDNTNIIHDEADGEDINVLTFDTGITGIALQEQMEENALDYITHLGVSLVRGTLYAYCIDTDHDSILDDIFDKLPDINIKLSPSMTYIISPQQYIVDINNDSLHYQFCLDISFDEDNGICLGSHVMEKYLILYDEDNEKIGIYDANENHQRQRMRNGLSGSDPLDLIDKEKSYIYALSIGLFILLVCLLFISGICVCLLRRTIRSRRKQNYEYNPVTPEKNGRRKSVTIDSSLSAQQTPPEVKAEDVDINTPEQQLELDSSNASQQNNRIASASPLQKYLNGNVKSIVYDQVIKPWNMQKDLDNLEEAI